MKIWPFHTLPKVPPHQDLFIVIRRESSPEKVGGVFCLSRLLDPHVVKGGRQMVQRNQADS